MENNYNRLEVIDQTGRVLVINECSDVELQVQDDGKTLKILLKNTGFKPHREDYSKIFYYAENNFNIDDPNDLFFNTDILIWRSVNEFYLGSALFEYCPEGMEYNQWLEKLTKEEISKYVKRDKAEIIIAKYMLENKYSELFIDNR